MDNAKELKRANELATEYVNKVGRPERHFTPTSYGRLFSLKVETCICHQENTGSTNYWNDKNFDAALATVIQGHFADLAAKALGLMHLNYAKAMIAEKENLQKQLAEIEALEESCGD